MTRAGTDFGAASAPAASASPDTAPVLVLWDLDLTLLDPAGFGSRMITPVLTELLGHEPVMGASFAGRTDHAILTDLLVRNGVTLAAHSEHSCSGNDAATLPGADTASRAEPTAITDADPAHTTYADTGTTCTCASCTRTTCTCTTRTRTTCTRTTCTCTSCTDTAHIGEISPLVRSVMDAVAERCERFGDDLLAGGGGPLPGAHDAVRALAADPLAHQGIVTGNMRRTALLKLRMCGFDGLPDPALGAFGDHRSDRAHLVLDAVDAARGQGIDVSPARAVVVGDHVHDVRGALDAGARCVAVATGRVSAEELRAAGAHVVLPDLTDTDALVSALRASILS